MDLKTENGRYALLAVHHLVLIDGKHLGKFPALALVVGGFYAVLHPFDLRVLGGYKF